MTIYNFNLGIGWASSGVEYAQAYRANIFRKNKQNSKFIFTDMFFENIQGMTSNLGFKDSEIIWLYQFYTDIKVKPTSFRIKDLESRFELTPSSVNKKTNNVITYHFIDLNMQINVFLTKNGKFVSKTEEIVNGNLVKRDYYSYTKIFSEYFKPVNKEAHLFQRRFFNEDGSVAYEELINGKQSLYTFVNRTIYSFEAFVSDFIKNLKLTDKDILIVDRSTHIGPEIIRQKGNSKVGVVIHAEHFNEAETNNDRILWNNYYDYQFQNAKSIDFYITATDIQKNILEAQFMKYKKMEIKVYTIPVGSLDKLEVSLTKRKPTSLITASRLAKEKHIDWIIEAVVKAREEVKDLTLDIYGEGGERETLQKLIFELNAENYIRLMGQTDLKHVYKKYMTYISGSTSEGFGLTLMEAVGSGLSMIGFNVRYGNPTFISNDENGFLVDYIKNKDEENIDHLYQSIIKVSNKKNELKFQNKSYELAKPYLTKQIQVKWENLEREILND